MLLVPLLTSSSLSSSASASLKFSFLLVSAFEFCESSTPAIVWFSAGVLSSLNLGDRKELTLSAVYIWIKCWVFELWIIFTELMNNSMLVTSLFCMLRTLISSRETIPLETPPFFAFDSCFGCDWFSWLSWRRPRVLIEPICELLSFQSGVGSCFLSASFPNDASSKVLKKYSPR